MFWREKQRKIEERSRERVGKIEEKHKRRKCECEVNKDKVIVKNTCFKANRISIKNIKALNSVKVTFIKQAYLPQPKHRQGQAQFPKW